MKSIFFFIFLIGGLFFFAVGTLGILRFPDLYTRAHSSAKCDTLGAFLTLMSFCIYNGLNMVTLKIVLIIIFLFITTPTATHIIARGNYERKEDSKNGDF
jgi:multicomponent Na+:H+ antiporter subunit G